MSVTIAPLHDLVLGGPSSVGRGQVFFAADGRLYAETSERVLNVWNVLVFHWPEVLAALLVLVLFAVLILILRVRRRPRQVGLMYCRRCNYDLSGLAEGVDCPECGSDRRKTRPVIGRRLRRRLAMPVAVGLSACAGYAALHVSGVPRINRAMGLLHWGWPRLAAFAQAHQIQWLEIHNVPEASLIELEPASGKVIRRVCSLSFRSAFRLSPSPDGRLGVATLDRGELAAIDLHTGRIERKASRPDGGIGPGNPYSGSCWRHVVGWSGDRTIWVQFFDAVAPRNTAYRWDISTGDLRPFVEAATAPSSVSGSDAARALYLIPGTDPPLACEMQDRGESGLGYGAVSTILVRDLGTDGRIVREIKSNFWAGCAPVFRADSSAFYIRGWGSADIMLWSLKDGSKIGELPAPGFMGTLQDGPAGLAVDAGSHRLFVATTGPAAVHVRDTDAKKWIAMLSFGMDALPDDFIAVSPDGRWVVINATEVLGAKRGGATTPPTSPRFKDHVLIFDLNNLDAPAEEGP